MRDGRSAQTRYSAVPARDVELVALSHIKECFELAPKSRIAEEAVRHTSKALEAHEAEQGTERLKPGEMLIEHEGRPVKMPLLSPKWGRRLAEGLSVTAVRRRLEYEYERLQRLAEVSEDATLENLWRWVDQKELARAPGCEIRRLHAVRAPGCRLPLGACAKAP